MRAAGRTTAAPLAGAAIAGVTAPGAGIAGGATTSGAAGTAVGTGTAGAAVRAAGRAARPSPASAGTAIRTGLATTNSVATVRRTTVPLVRRVLLRGT